MAAYVSMNNTCCKASAGAPAFSAMSAFGTNFDILRAGGTVLAVSIFIALIHIAPIIELILLAVKGITTI